MTAVAKKTPDADTSEDTARVAPLVHERCVFQNKAGSRFCQWEAIAPEGATFDDLLDPAVWKRVQGNKRPAIRQDDEIRIKAYDRSWVVWCFVAHAAGNGIILSRFADAKPQGPREHLYEDDRYRVVYVGSGYTVHRKNDGVQMKDIFSSAAGAETALRELYPKQVS